MIYVLKTCPFCGKLPVETDEDLIYKINCGNYRCLVFPSVEIKWTKIGYEPWSEIEAIKKAWNTRK